MKDGGRQLAATTSNDFIGLIEPSQLHFIKNLQSFVALLL